MSNIDEHIASLITEDIGPDEPLLDEELEACAGSRYFCESLFWASQPKQAAKT